MQRKYKLALAVVPVLVVLDQLTKVMMREILFPGRVIPVIPGIFQFQYAENSGMAFGMLQNLPEAWRTPFFSLITIVATLIIAHLFRQTPGQALRLPLALSMILAGALGNLINRFLWGVVIDFIRVQVWPPSRYYWPTFNLADTFISLGIIVLIADTLFWSEETVPAPKEAAEEQAPLAPAPAGSPPESSESGVSAVP